MKKKIIFIIIGVIVAIIAGTFIYFGNRYYCRDGYQLYGDKCLRTIYITPMRNEYCDEGFVQTNDECVKANIVKPQYNYFCMDTAEKDGDLIVTASTLSGTKCNYQMKHQPIERRYCQATAYLLNSTTCRDKFVTAAHYRAFDNSYYCVLGYLEGTTCVRWIDTPVMIEKICASTFKLSGNWCIRNESYDAAYTLTCPTGYILEENFCLQTETREVNVEYLCPTDYILKSGSCEQVLEKPAMKGFDL